MALRFEQANALAGGAWRLRVLMSRRVIGRITRAADGTYCFFKGTGGPGRPFIEKPLAQNKDLEKLKEWLEINANRAWRER